MSVYEGFAFFYSIGTYTQYSHRMAELLPQILEKYQAKPKTILDLACGEGTFAILMSQKGHQVTGVDNSESMLRIASERAEREQTQVEFLNADMRSLTFDRQFDLITCWFDSLNYLLELPDLEQTFQGVSKSLKNDGLFIFDINTIYGLAVNWQRHPAYVEQDTPDIFVVHQPSYDYERNLATMRITGFMRDQEGWFRIDEVHTERGYPLEDIQTALKKANLVEIACLGSVAELGPPTPDSSRVWFVAQKKA
ncbi:MAG: class I SAM-dependent methyltransferase [Anaerolineales bacterium]|nr:class I SAM-dependent methyltransferase [Anaerolineales bacterium]